MTLGASDRDRAAAALRTVGISPGHHAVCYPAGTKNVTIKVWPPDRYGMTASGHRPVRRQVVQPRKPEAAAHKRSRAKTVASRNGSGSQVVT